LKVGITIVSSIGGEESKRIPKNDIIDFKRVMGLLRRFDSNL
jgi:hypothetical protein